MIVEWLMTRSTPIQCFNFTRLFWNFFTNLKHFPTLQKFPTPWMVLSDYFLSVFLRGSRGIRPILLLQAIHSSSTFSSPEILLAAKKCRGNVYFFIHLRSCESKTQQELAFF